MSTGDAEVTNSRISAMTSATPLITPLLTVICLAVRSSKNSYLSYFLVVRSYPHIPLAAWLLHVETKLRTSIAVRTGTAKRLKGQTLESIMVLH